MNDSLPSPAPRGDPAHPARAEPEPARRGVPRPRRPYASPILTLVLLALLTIVTFLIPMCTHLS